MEQRRQKELAAPEKPLTAERRKGTGEEVIEIGERIANLRRELANITFEKYEKDPNGVSAALAQIESWLQDIDSRLGNLEVVIKLENPETNRFNLILYAMHDALRFWQRGSSTMLQALAFNRERKEGLEAIEIFRKVISEAQNKVADTKETAKMRARAKKLQDILAKDEGYQNLKQDEKTLRYELDLIGKIKHGYCQKKNVGL